MKGLRVFRPILLGSLWLLASSLVHAQSAPSAPVPPAPPAPVAPSATDPQPTPVAPPRRPEVVNAPAEASVAMEPRFYIGADFGNATQSIKGVDVISPDRRESLSGTLVLGLALDERLAVELSHTGYEDFDFISAFFGAATVTQRTTAITGVGSLPLSRSFSAYLRLGAAYGTQQISERGRVTRDRSKTTVLYGLGIEQRLGRRVSLTFGVDFIDNYAGAGSTLRDVKGGIRVRF